MGVKVCGAVTYIYHNIYIEVRGQPQALVFTFHFAFWDMVFCALPCTRDYGTCEILGLLLSASHLAIGVLRLHMYTASSSFVWFLVTSTWVFMLEWQVGHLWDHLLILCLFLKLAYNTALSLQHFHMYIFILGVSLIYPSPPCLPFPLKSF